MNDDEAKAAINLYYGLRKIDKLLEKQEIILRRMIRFRKEWAHEYHKNTIARTKES